MRFDVGDPNRRGGANNCSEATADVAELNSTSVSLSARRLLDAPVPALCPHPELSCRP
jgi:hypothetical protein